MSRRRAREIALQALFHLDLNPMKELEEGANEIALEAVIEEFVESTDTTKKDISELYTPEDKEFSQCTLVGTRRNISAIDEMIASFSKGWKLSRMSGIDRNILRMATYELKFAEEGLDSGIIINEAVELAKKYGTDKSSGFVNGILSSINKKKD